MIPQYSGGGADGSIMIFQETELQNGANTNLDVIIGTLGNLLSQYRSMNTGVVVSAGDMWVLTLFTACSSDPSLLAVSNLLLPLASVTVPVLHGFHFSLVVPMQQWLLIRT